MDATAQQNENTTNETSDKQVKKKKCSGTCPNCVAKRLAKLSKETTSPSQ